MLWGAGHREPKEYSTPLEPIQVHCFFFVKYKNLNFLGQKAGVIQKWVIYSDMSFVSDTAVV